jgi:hypothetical protein
MKAMAMAVAVLVFGCAVVPTAFAQEGGPPRLSSNPGKHAIFPAKGQTAEQQEKDQTEAYAWASKQTGWDPYKASEEVAKAEQANQATADSTRGDAVGGAARGALLGVAIGAIADDAGKGAAIGAAAGGLTRGMRSRQVRQGAKADTKAGQEEFKQKFQEWDKFFVAAMEGKEYTVRFEETFLNHCLYRA